MSQELTLAKLLNLRKHLVWKIDQLKPIKLQAESGIFETKKQRVKVSETHDEITITQSKVDAKEITKEYDTYAKELRLVDDAIQFMNHTTIVTGYTPNTELAII